MMKINFTHIFQDSWHFIQNQMRTSVFLFIIQFASALFIAFLGSLLLSGNTISVSANPLPQLNEYWSFVLLFIVKQVAYLFIGCWSLMVIHQISHQQFQSYGHSALQTGGRFWGALVVNILIASPILIGLVESLLAMQQKTQPSMISLFAIMIGIIFFVRLCLAPVHYLLNTNRIGTAIQQFWQMGKGRAAPLFIYCLLIYLAQPLLEAQLSLWLASNLVFSVIGLGISTAVNTFLLIVSYRFYTLFSQKD